MHFEASSSVTLLFDFWDVHGPAGMVLSVFVVLMFTLFYELLKVLKVELSDRLHEPASPFPSPFTPQATCFPPPPPCLLPQLEYHESNSAIVSSPSESSLNPADSANTPAANTNWKRWLLHGLQTLLHTTQVTLGYLLMLCVMTYNIWIFLGVIMGSVLGYFLAFPLLSKV
ncbi:hypothetical protein ACEWY4_003920 [Coilia grayii]|uniref:Copper transport protein n=1 Tax=Coilia grayii TaxID=363190 RepID=A0ABD1KKL9_9TELE